MSQNNQLDQIISEEYKQLIDLNKNRFLNRVLETKNRNPYLKKLLLLGSGLSFGLCLKRVYELENCKREIQDRKQKLQEQEHILSIEQSTNLPWSKKENVKQWLHQPVQVVGRPIHGKQMMVPRRVKGHNGYDCIVPLVTKENEDGTQQYGMLLNMGWVPRGNKEISNRFRIENVDWQTFNCVVSQNQELERSLFQKGNNQQIRPSEFTHKLNEYNHIDIAYMAQKTNFVNWEQSKFALVEQVNLKTQTKLDEKNQQYELDATQTQNYPILKTKAGCLQLKEMPWHISHSAKNYGLLSAVLFASSAIL